jgi:biopolymer transport protein ExbB/TolQ
VSRQRKASAVTHVAAAVGWPLIIGLAATSLFYAAVFRGPLNLPFIHRYFAGHPISFAETALFFVGLAALLRKLVEVALQNGAMSVDPIDATPSEAQSVEDAAALLQSLDARPERVRESYLGRRVREALAYVHRSGSAHGLEDELKFLGEQDSDKQYESYSLVRIVIWAIPMLGFLGTVMGISQALGNLDPAQLAQAPQEAATVLKSGLYVAFDTTSVALSMSLLLMFLQFPVDRVEVEMLSSVAHRTAELLQGRFESTGGGLDPHVASIERMCYAVMRSVENSVHRQADVWRESLDHADRQWRDNWQEAAEQLRAALTGSLDQTFTGFADRMQRVESEATHSAQQRWQQWQAALESGARVLTDQQEACRQQSELLRRIVEATGDVVQLEKSLNENLHALSGARHFEEMVTSLAAAIQLLSSRLSPVADARKIDLRPASAKSERAA